MKYLKRNLDKLNDLLNLNYQVEQIYDDLLEDVNDEDIITLIRRRRFERKQNSDMLRKKIIELKGFPKSFEALDNIYYRSLFNIKKLINKEETNKAIDKLCRIEEQSIANYNAFLQERNVPLSICKILVVQRDRIQKSLNKLKVREMVAA